MQQQQQQQQSVASSYSPKVYFTIFAGRERYLSILRRYLDRLLAKGSITEIHVWDYARKSSDAAYLKTLCESPGYRLFHPENGARIPSRASTPAGPWSDYYLHYCMNVETGYAPTDILIKCDDDVVFLDVDNFDRFVAEIKHGTLYFPNIVNNDVCAHIQTRHHGVHDLLAVIDDERTSRGFGQALDNDWWCSNDAAVNSHNHFLVHGKEAYALPLQQQTNVEWQSRISINLFAATMLTAKQSFALFKALNNVLRDNVVRNRVRVSDAAQCDEQFLSAELCRLLDRPNIIVPCMVAVHFSFENQDPGRLDAAFLADYDKLSKDSKYRRSESPAVCKQLLCYEHGTLCSNVAGYLDKAHSTKLSDGTPETPTTLWQIYLEGWAFPLNTHERRPIRFRDCSNSKSDAITLLEPKRRDDVAAAYRNDPDVTWSGWAQHVHCYRAKDGSDDRALFGVLEMLQEEEEAWTIFMDISFLE